MADDKKQEAEKLVKKFAQEAQAELDGLGSVHKFKMSKECEDKEGNATKAFIIDTDRAGILGMFIKHGQPVTLSQGGDLNVDQDKLAAYFGFMANIDVTKDENLSAIGWGALAKGRELVSSFFTLRLASDMFSA